MTTNAQSNNQPQHEHSEAESLRLKQEQQQDTEASFQETYDALKKLLNVKQKKYQKTIELAFLEGKISLKAVAVFALLMIFTCVFITVLWCLINVAIVAGLMQAYSSLWLGLLVAGGINTLIIALLVTLMKKVKREVGFDRTKRVLKGDSV